jgi:hypothetical protein
MLPSKLKLVYVTIIKLSQETFLLGKIEVWNFRVTTILGRACDVENCLWEKCTKLAFTHGGHNLGNLRRLYIGIIQTFTYKLEHTIRYATKCNHKIGDNEIVTFELTKCFSD